MLTVPTARQDSFEAVKPMRGSAMRGAAAKSAKRAFELLELFASRPDEGWSVTQVARALEYPVSSTSILLRELSQLGYITQGGDKRLYRASLRSRFIGAALSQQDTALHTMRTLVDRLAVETGEEVVLASENGSAAQYIYLRHATLPFQGRQQVGANRPICRTSFGKALLARKTDAELALLVRRLNAESQQPRIDMQPLMREIDLARRHSMALAFEEATPGAAGLSVILPEGFSDQPVALAICGPVDRIRQRLPQLTTILAQLRDGGFAAQA